MLRMICKMDGISVNGSVNSAQVHVQVKDLEARIAELELQLRSSYSLLQLGSYAAAEWQVAAIEGEGMVPKNRVSLGRFPTPVHDFNINAVSKINTSIKLSIKRDDCSSSDLSGNKVRKLEFLLGQALSNSSDSVITAGGLQSNHARATAVAGRLLGLQPHLILRTTLSVQDIGLTGNLLWNRMVGSKIYTIHPSQYARIGSDKLIDLLQKKLADAGGRPYSIPVGGSNSLGSFGYMEAIKEIIAYEAATEEHFDHIVFSCGSGGTAAGLAIGGVLSGLTERTTIHGVVS